jgi:hypothetical protein
MSEIAQRAAAAESGGAAIPEGFSPDLYNEDLAPLNGWWVFFGLILGTGVVMALMNLTEIAG